MFITITISCYIFIIFAGVDPFTAMYFLITVPPGDFKKNDIQGDMERENHRLLNTIHKFQNPSIHRHLIRPRINPQNENTIFNIQNLDFPLLSIEDRSKIDSI